MIRRLIVPGLAAAVAAGALVTLPTADAAPRGAACRVAGNATISPGLKATAATQKITIKVTTLQCVMGSSTSPGVPKPINAKATISPTPLTAKAACSNGNLAFSATITWGGKTTTVKITTTGLTASQTLRGNVTSSTDPTFKKGDLVAGEVAFRPNPPAQNCVTTPVKSVDFAGALGVGAPN